MTASVSSRCRRATEKEDVLGTPRRDLERKMLTAGFRFSWKKMAAAAQDRAGWRQLIMELHWE